MDCPTQEELQRLCRASSIDGVDQSLMSHVVACEACQEALRQLAEPLAEFAPTLAQLAQVMESPTLQDRLEGLKLQRPSPRPGHPTRHEDLHPWIEAGETELGRVDHYDLIRCIGRGGMGVVFEAFDRELQRTVAVKLMSPALLVDASYSERVLREARAVAAMDCPSVVKVFAVSKIRDLPYLVMEYVEGESLQQRLDRSPELAFGNIVQIACNLAEGLAAAHAVGVIHRDIKPANVLIRAESGQAMITDFGLAIQSSANPITQTGMLMGTPEFLAPEQVDGKPVDHRSDLFSLGSLLYQLCSGETPFSEPTLVATLKAVTTEKLPELAKRFPSTPVWMSDLVSRLHEKNPIDRIQTASEVVDCLQHRKGVIQEDGPATLHGKGILPWLAAFATLALLIGTVAGYSRYMNEVTSDVSSEEFLAASAQDLMQYLESVDGDVTIQVAAGAIFELEPIQFFERSVEIVAVEGEPPIFRFEDDAHEAAIICVDGRLDLQGIRFESLASDPDEFGDAPLILCDGGSVMLTSCEVVSRYRGCLVLVESECELHQSVLQTDRHAIEIQPEQGSCELKIFDSTIESNVGIGVESGGSVHLVNTKIQADVAFETRYRSDETNQLLIIDDNNRFDCETATVTVFGVPQRRFRDTVLEQALSVAVQWRSSDSEPSDLSMRLVSTTDEERTVSIRVTSPLIAPRS